MRNIEEMREELIGQDDQRFNYISFDDESAKVLLDGEFTVKQLMDIATLTRPFVD